MQLLWARWTLIWWNKHSHRTWLNTTVSVLNLIINRGYQTILKDEILPSCNRLNILSVTLKMCISKYILLYSKMQIYTNYLNKASTH